MIRLHHVPASRSFRVLWFLEELGLEYKTVEYSIRDGSLRTPAFLAISPAGRVPALEIDGRVLFESGAILQTLCEIHPQAGFAPLPGTQGRDRFLEVLSYSETMASLIEQLNMQNLFLRDPSQASPVVLKVITARLASVMRAFEGILGDRDYVLDTGFSAADAMMGFNLFAAPYYVKMDGFDVLKAYAKRLSERPAYVAAMANDGEQDFYTKDFYPVPGT